MALVRRVLPSTVVRPGVFRFLFCARHASTAAKEPSDDDKTVIVLGKPERFNPPSHGSRLRSNVLPKHYGPTLTPSERLVQKMRSYPGLLPPEGTLAHRVWTSRMLHVWITMGVLVLLGVSTFFLNIAYHSPCKDLLPPISDLWDKPAYFFRTWKNVVIMHEKVKGERAIEARERKLNDVEKRKLFMKMHGIEVKDPILMVFGKGEKMWPDEEQEAGAGTEPMAESNASQSPDDQKKDHYQSRKK